MQIEPKNQTDKTLISSKEILKKTGISRATLNNYIKLGILPRPIVRRPLTGSTTIKKIGYFPETVLDRIDTVKIMKKEGYTIDEIASRFRGEATRGRVDAVKDSIPGKLTVEESPDLPLKLREELSITFEEIGHPTYLINENFEIIWINEAAERKLFKQKVSHIAEGINRNIFKLFFHWEISSSIKNWKDLIAFHIGFAKSKFSHEWIKRIYKGISEREGMVLSELYEKALSISGKTIMNRPVFFLNKDNTTRVFRVYVLFCKEGLLFIYVPEENF